MYCLDTDIIIEYLRGNQKIVERLTTIYTHGVGLFTTFINICELYKGVYMSKHKDKGEADIELLLHTVRGLEMDKHSCMFFGREWSRLKKIGKQTQILDLIIASVATVNNLTLVTRNKRHYNNIENLRVEEW